MALPKQISPSPLVNAIIEIRVSSELKSEDIIATFFPILNERFSKLTKFGEPVLSNSISSPIPGVKNEYWPAFTFENSNYAVSIGPKVVNFRLMANYQLWDNFAKEFQEVMILIASKNWITKIERIGIRYGNIFENKEPQTVFKVSGLGFKDYSEKLLVSISRLKKGDYEIVVQIAENIKGKMDNREVIGPMLDTDIYTTTGLPESVDGRLFDIISDMHTEQKELFFHLVNPEYIKTLQVKY